MSDTREFTGKTLEEALEAAAEFLNVEPGNLDYEVIESPKRFFFMSGAKEFRIAVLTGRSQDGPAPSGTDSAESDQAVTAGDDALSDADSGSNEDETPVSVGDSGPATTTPPSSAAADDDDQERETEEELDRIRETARHFIDLWGMDMQADVISNDERVEIHFHGKDQDYLLEKKGAALLSMQLIMGKILYRQGLIRRKLQVDCDGYRKRRELELQQIAGRLADRVKETGDASYMSPLNPYERRIVHLMIMEDPAVTTLSEGDGYKKRIRITPA